MRADKIVIFNTEEVAKIDAETTDRLKRLVTETGQTARLCLHRQPQDLLHEMLIAHPRANYVRPHRHDGESESFFLLDGGMRVILFDDEGRVTDWFEMTPPGAGGCFVCRLPRGQWHTMFPWTHPVLFLEQTEGPFKGAAHNTFAPWSPRMEDTAAAEAYMRDLLVRTGGLQPPGKPTR